MITSKQQKVVNAKFCFRTLYDTQKPFYTYIGHDNVWIPAELQLPLFTDEMIGLNLARNVFPSRDTSYQWFNWFIDYGVVIRGDDIVLYSTRPFTHAFGAFLNKSTYIAMYESSSWKVITDWEEIQNQPLNTRHFLIYDNTKVTWEDFFILFNAVTYQKIIPKYEYLLPPFHTHMWTVPLWEKIKKLEVGETLTINIPRRNDYLPNSYTLYPLRLVIGANGKFYKYSSENGFEEINLVSEFITKEEIISNGITIEQFNNITKTDWNVFVSDKCSDIYIYTCGYMLPSIIKEELWTDQLDTNRFLWVINRKKKNLVIAGEI